MACEDYPSCGHGPPPFGDGGGCPDKDGRFKCVTCDGRLPKGASSSICIHCQRRAERRRRYDRYDPYGDHDHSMDY